MSVGICSGDGRLLVMVGHGRLQVWEVCLQRWKAMQAMVGICSGDGRLLVMVVVCCGHMRLQMREVCLKRGR